MSNPENPNKTKLTINNRNIGGMAVSAAEYQRRKDEFDRMVDSRYEEIVSDVVSEIQRNEDSDSGRIKKLFEYFTDDSMSFDSSVYYYDHNSNLRARAVTYSFEDNKDFTIGSETKYPAILNKTGVCQTFSLAFEDILNNWLKIPCRSIGYESHGNAVGHAWNIVLVDGEFKSVDIGRFLELRGNGMRVNRENYCLVDIDERRGERFRVEKEEMKRQYSKLHPKITIQNRSDTPRITIQNRSDTPRITILDK